MAKSRLRETDIPSRFITLPFARNASFLSNPIIAIYSNSNTNDVVQIWRMSVAYRRRNLHSNLVTGKRVRHFGMPIRSTPSHYLNQCWDIFYWSQRNKLQWNFNQNTESYIHQIAIENTVWEMTAIFSRQRWVTRMISASVLGQAWLNKAVETIKGVWGSGSLHPTLHENYGMYRKTSNIRRTESPNLIAPRLVAQLCLPNPMKPGVKLRIKI